MPMHSQVLDHTLDGSGPEVLVLVPGGLTGAQSWSPLVPSLAANHRVLLVQPVANAEGAAGRTGHPDYAPELEQQNLALTLEAAVGHARVHLVGWSNGARAALAFAVANPERIKSVTAVEPAAWWLVGEREDARAFHDLITGLHGIEVDDAALCRFIVEAGVAPASTDPASLPGWPLWRACANSLSWFGPDFVDGARSQLTNLERLDRPVLLIRGTQTAGWLREVVDVLAARLPSAETLELEGGHACFLQNSEIFIAALDRHVGSAR